MEQWSVTLTGDVQPGADAASAWQRVAEKLGQDREAFEQKIRQRLPVTFRATDNSGAQRHLGALEACGVDGLVLGDDGQRLWVRIGDTTRGPVSTAFARRALTQGDWNGQTQVCRTGETQWQPLQAVIPTPESPVQGPAPPSPPEPETSTPSPAPGAPPQATAPTPSSVTATPANQWSGELPVQIEAPGLYAGFWMRAAAYLLDYLILFVGVYLAVIAAGIFMGQQGDSDPGISVLGYLLLNLLVPWFYYAAFESSGWQATPGKRALGLRVVDMHGARIGFGRATGRFFGRIISAIILCVGYMMAGWTARKQALHDMMAGCCVVRQGGLDARAQNRLSSFHATMPAWAVVLVVCGALGLLVIPILAAIAVPAYQDYVVRVQVSEGMALSEPVRSVVDKYLTANGTMPDSNLMAGLGPPASIHGKYVRAVEVVNGNGDIRVTFGGNQVSDQIRNGRLMFIAERDGLATHWTCGSLDIPRRYLPIKCRQKSVLP